MATSQENENNSAKRYSFKNWFQTSMTLVHPQWKIIRLDDSFVIFWGHELTINKFKLIDPRQKKHDVGIQKLENGDFIIHEGLLEICQYYNLKENKVIHVNYVDKDTFLFKVFSAEAIEIDYTS
ncbi:hypothetical protein DEO72_LG8g1311 [Vigna unguiculata]|uniref:TF-B3 domain-containing protein n=1 Tax=Vigna unguiculata TaxID=3917 RepID=A0A4D6MTS3_VIGUN|nr:hypothetical protein DEO72_LG8g1311 [Vigna unguiculata]